MNLDDNFKEKVLAELLKVRSNYTGTDTVFANQYEINPSVFNRMKRGNITGLLRDTQWLAIGRKLNIRKVEKSWNTARTEVFQRIEEEVVFCKEFSKARIFVDDCGIGKSYVAKHLSRTLKNCFYLDASQAKTKSNFIRLLARTVGADTNGKISEILENVKYYISILPQPIIILDEAGDLDYGAFLAIKELWNATENQCGWYMMGAEGLKAKINKGINGKKVGYREIFSRFSDKYSSVVPVEKYEKIQFFKKLVEDVLTVNMEDKSNLSEIIAKSLIDINGNYGGLRRAESLLILNR